MLLLESTEQKHLLTRSQNIDVESQLHDTITLELFHKVTSCIHFDYIVTFMKIKQKTIFSIRN